MSATNGDRRNGTAPTDEECEQTLLMQRNSLRWEWISMLASTELSVPKHSSQLDAEGRSGSGLDVLIGCVRDDGAVLDEDELGINQWGGG